MTIIYKEQGSISKIKDILSIEKPNSILLITGNKSYESSGAKKNIEPQIQGYNVIHLNGFSMYPPKENVQEAIDIIKQNNIDFIIGVGGGTVMDISKASSILCNESGKLENYITGKQKPEGKNIKRLLIPTTAGTGAEITPYSSIYINTKKYSLSHPSMAPDYIILAPELTHSLNPEVTAQTGYDAFAQAIESFWSTKSTQESKEYSKKAMHLILNNLEGAVNNPNNKNRKNMLFGSYLAGKAIAMAGTTAPHVFSHSIMTNCNIPHGQAVSFTLPYFFQINENITNENIQEGLKLGYVKETFSELLSELGVKNGTEARDMLLNLAHKINLDRKLSSFRVKEKDLEKILRDINLTKLSNNPVKITREMSLDILREIL